MEAAPSSAGDHVTKGFWGSSNDRTLYLRDSPAARQTISEACWQRLGGGSCPVLPPGDHIQRMEKKNKIKIKCTENKPNLWGVCGGWDAQRVWPVSRLLLNVAANLHTCVDAPVRMRASIRTRPLITTFNFHLNYIYSNNHLQDHTLL